MKSSVSALVAMACLVVSPSTAGAQSEAGPASHGQSDEDACRPDVFRLCMSEIPDETAIVSCLNTRLPQLSPACHAVMAPQPAAPPRKRRRGHRV